MNFRIPWIFSVSSAIIVIVNAAAAAVGVGEGMPKIEDATLQGEQSEVRWGAWAHAILEIPVFAPWKLYLESIVILCSMKFQSGNFVEFLVYLVEAGGRPPFLDLDCG